ncbi:MAG TPA: bifunctional tetrahydrofolate synthase/dihydrofolate synthase [Thiotrichales bacterium]|nr:bifunctional tetrahydrofolate synthase/dihydrofolate synthase [Thiotrichales bacterium]
MQTLAEWLAWLEGLDPARIELGLGRMRTVHERLGPGPLARILVTVGGTNGKGSLVALFESVAQAAGLRVGAYTSPHIERYNERVRIDGRPVSDEALVEAFRQVEAARGKVPLTYFEFGTLAAFCCFAREPLDLALLEVGLGGRLDAVNVVDADCALLGQIALDHLDWLGPDREAVGREKAGILRPGRPAICADPRPPASVRAAADKGALLRVAGEDFRWQVHGDGRWDWQGMSAAWRALPSPGLAGRHQYGNAAAVLAALEALGGRLPVPEAAIREGLARARLPGRFEIVAEAPQLVLDVAHNPAAAEALAGVLGERPVAGRTLALYAALEDKSVAGVVAALQPRIDRWHLAGLDVPRGLSASALARRLPSGLDPVLHDRVSDALEAALAEAGPEDRVLVFGSFFTVAQARAAAL